MKNTLWALVVAVAVCVGSSAAQAQFGQPYNPLPGRPNIPGVYGGRDPFGPRTPVIPGVPGGYDPFGGSRLPGSPMGRQPWMPPTVQDILNQNQSGYPMAGQRFDPRANNDPLAPFRAPGGVHVNPPIPGVRFDPMVVQPGGLPPAIEAPKIDPKVFEQITIPPIRLTDLEAKPPTAHGGGGPPAWLRWEYGVGIFVVAALAGLLHALFGRKASV